MLNCKITTLGPDSSPDPNIYYRTDFLCAQGATKYLGRIVCSRSDAYEVRMASVFKFTASPDAAGGEQAGV